MTVGAVNINGELVGYSSQGPAALDPRKLDFCSVTHFKGYFASDSGTSAATPIAAGVTALLKQANRAILQQEVKQALCDTARDIGPGGWDQHSGHGIIQAKAAYDRIRTQQWSGWSTLEGIVTSDVTVARNADGRLEVFVKGADNAVYHKWQEAPKGGWVQDWGGLAGVIRSDRDIAVGQNADGRLEVFVIGTDNRLYHKWQESITTRVQVGQALAA